MNEQDAQQKYEALFSTMLKMREQLTRADERLEDCLRVLKMTARWVCEDGHSRWCKCALTHDVPEIISLHCDCGATERILEVRACLKKLESSAA